MTERSAEPSRSVANPRRTRHSATAAPVPVTEPLSTARSGSRVASAVRCRLAAATPAPGERSLQLPA